MERPRTRYAKAGDIHIAYQVFGDGPIDLLWAQGWATHIEYAWESPDYARFLTKISRFARVIFFDKRGVGMSDRDVGYPTLEERSQDINAVLDAVGTDRAAIFGMSEGGAISCVFSATYPERVSHLILFGCRARYRWAPDYPHGLKPDEVQASIEYFSNYAGGHFLGIDGAPSIADDPAAQRWLDTYFRYAASPRALRNLAEMNYDIDVRSVLSSIRAPTLVLHRENENWCDLANAKYLAEHIPGAKLRVLPGEDHIAWYGDQDRLVSEIRAFVTGDTVSTPTERTLLTLVFLDLVDSTEHLARMGDERWRSVLEQLDHTVRRHVSAYGGTTVKHTGDGYLLSFRGPTSALECALTLRRDVAGLGLQSRTGVHTGECEIRGQDLSGATVHVAARLMHEAAPDEILTSQTVKDLTLGSEREFHRLEPRKLRGIPGKWTPFALTD
ncbi:hydrolase [Ruegeria marisrubri]|uniref:Hydrolase n=1 Tax=Ruegeria marisrubri TaxID=1685379 RepID=A0A0X3THN2_9RHOB|nr:adenylate/guanylate cyclase domain-containing protein [Ruegeria marisrubri]KUJ73806.1 hydrolase [Ruegeria marisrubri]